MTMKHEQIILKLEVNISFIIYIILTYPNQMNQICN